MKKKVLYTMVPYNMVTCSASCIEFLYCFKFCFKEHRNEYYDKNKINLSYIYILNNILGHF